MLLIILQIVLIVFLVIQLYRKKEEIKSLKEENKMLILIYAIDRQKTHLQRIDELKEELEQLRQEKWVNI